MENRIESRDPAEEEMFRFLDLMQRRGVSDVTGLGPVLLMETFGLTIKEAQRVVRKWSVYLLD